MRKLLVALAIAFILFSCDNKVVGGVDMNTVDRANSFVGTWEAEGDYFSYAMGENRNYKCTLIFHNNTEYTGRSYVRRIGTVDWQNDGESRGTYAYDGENITYTVKYYYLDGGVSPEYSGTYAYKFNDQNTLVTGSIDLNPDAGIPIFRKKD